MELRGRTQKIRDKRCNRITGNSVVTASNQQIDRQVTGELEGVMVAVARPVVFSDVLPKIKARSYVLVVGFAALTALLAQISIHLDFTPVPITGQTLGALLAGAALGMRLGALSQLLYVVAGLFLPVYAGNGEFASGWDVLSGATGGYLVGMILAAAVVGKLAERSQDRSFITSIPAMITGSVIVYAVGATYFSIVDNISIQTAIEKGVAPFLIGDALKSVLAGALLPATWHFIKKNEEAKTEA